MIPRAPWILTVLFWLPWGPLAHGHGTTIDVSFDAVSIRARYDDGGPMTGLIRMWRETATGDPVWTGETDVEGRATIRLPDPGRWVIEVDDEMGHVARRVVDRTARHADPGWSAPSKRLRVLAGVSVIFGVFGWWAFLRSRCRSSRAGEGM